MMNKVILDILDERGQMTEEELQQLVFHRIGYDNWTEFTIEAEMLIEQGGIGITPLPYGKQLFWKRVRTRPVSLIPVEVD